MSVHDPLWPGSKESLGLRMFGSCDVMRWVKEWWVTLGDWYGTESLQCCGHLDSMGIYWKSQLALFCIVFSCFPIGSGTSQQEQWTAQHHLQI